MGSTSSTAQRSPVAAIVLLVVATLLFLFMLVNAAQAPDLESIDKGVAAIYALISGVLLWIVLAALLVIGAARGGMPGWAAFAAMPLHPLSGAAAVAALFMLSANSDAPHWPVFILMMLPLSLGAYAAWALQARLHAVLPATLISAAVLGSVFVVSIGLLSYVTIDSTQKERQAAIDRREADAKFAAEALAKQQANLDRFNRLTDESPLSDWKPFIGKGNELEQQAVERVRKLAHRQDDAEAMLRNGQDFPLFHIRQLDLHATPAFCAGTNQFLIKNANDHRPAPSDQQYILMADRFDPYLPAMQRLIGQGCNLSVAVTATEDAVRAYPPVPERERFLSELARLHPDWQACNGAGNASPQQRIAGCTALIDAAGTKPEDLAVARFNRGDANLEQNRTEQAIQDYSAAIALKPDFEQALNNRANAYDDAGQQDLALHDYDEALRIDPSFAMAFSNRGLLYDERGEHDRAIQDYDQALRLQPKYRGALKNRGRARFFQGDFAAAVQDLGQALALAPTDAYALLWLDLARGRAGQASQDDLRRQAGVLNKAEWPWPLVAVFLGEQDASAVQTAAAASSEQDCDVGFYLGERAVLAKDVSAARALLQHAQQICRPTSVEYPAAKRELDRLPP